MYLAEDDKARLRKIVKGKSLTFGDMFMGLMLLVLIILPAIIRPENNYLTSLATILIVSWVLQHINNRFNALMTLLEQGAVKECEPTKVSEVTSSK